MLQIWTEQGWGALEGSLWTLQTHPGAGENGSGEREGEPWKGAGSGIPPGKTLLALQLKKKNQILEVLGIFGIFSMWLLSCLLETGGQLLPKPPQDPHGGRGAGQGGCGEFGNKEPFGIHSLGRTKVPFRGDPRDGNSLPLWLRWSWGSPVLHRTSSTSPPTDLHSFLRFIFIFKLVGGAAGVQPSHRLLPISRNTRAPGLEFFPPELPVRITEVSFLSPVQTSKPGLGASLNGAFVQSLGAEPAQPRRALRRGWGSPPHPGVLGT